MTYRAIIAGEHVLDIYHSADNRYWFVTERLQKDGQTYLSGYVRSAGPVHMLVEFRDLPEATLNTSEKSIWKVANKRWHMCPGIELMKTDKQGDNIEPDSKPTYFWKGASCSNNCKEVDKKMDQNIQAKLDKYLDLFEDLKQKTNDERAALTLLQEVSKDRRMEEIREEREAKNGEPATTKQLKFMKKLGIDVPPGITKREASILIDEELGRNGE